MKKTITLLIIAVLFTLAHSQNSTNSTNQCENEKNKRFGCDKYAQLNYCSNPKYSVWMGKNCKKSCCVNPGKVCNCTKESQPVCGWTQLKQKKTFINRCVAECYHNAKNITEGQCPPAWKSGEQQPCGFYFGWRSCRSYHNKTCIDPEVCQNHVTQISSYCKAEKCNHLLNKCYQGSNENVELKGCKSKVQNCAQITFMNKTSYFCASDFLCKIFEKNNTKIVGSCCQGEGCNKPDDNIDDDDDDDDEEPIIDEDDDNIKPDDEDDNNEKPDDEDNDEKPEVDDVQPDSD